MLKSLTGQTIAAALLLLGSLEPGHAAGDLADEDIGQPLWEFRLAAFARYGASYPASEENQLNIVPLPVPIYRGRFLRLFEDTEKPFRGRIFRRDRIKLDLDLGINFPVDSEDVDARADMPDLDLLLELGPELELEFTRQPKFGGRWYLGLQLRGAASFDGLSPDYRGLAFSPELKYIIDVGEREDEVKFRLTPTFATSKYMDFFYTVEPRFARAGRPAFDADGGYLGTELTVTWRRPLGERIEVIGGVRMGLHSGASNDDSPLFTEDLTGAVYAAFLYRFWASERKAGSRRNGVDTARAVRIRDTLEFQ